MPPPGTADFTVRVGGWLLDLCPARFRDHDVLRRHPRALAPLAQRHVEAQVQVLHDSLAMVRAELADAVDARTLDEVVAALEAESAALLADRRSVGLVARALTGEQFVRRF